MPEPDPRPAWSRHASAAPLVVAALLMAWLSLAAAAWWVGAAGYPYALENGEGWVLASAVELAEGRSPYVSLDDYPFVVGNYPPLYLLATAGAIRAWGFSPLYGRLISLAAWVAGVLMVVAGARRVGASWLAASVGGLYALAVPGMRLVALQVRVDLLAAALAVAGIVWLLGTDETPATLGPAVCFSAALATKHSMVAAPAAALVWLAWSDRRRAVRLALATAGLTAAWLAACWAAFGRSFFLNIGPYTAAIPWSWANLERMWRLALGPWYLPALAATVGYAAWALPRGGRRERLVALYGLAAAAGVVAVAKAGSSLLYLVEFTLAGSLCLASAAGRLLRAPALGAPPRRFAACLALALALFALQWPPGGYPLSRRLAEARRAWSVGWEGPLQRDELMVSLIRRAPGPVLAEEPIYLLAAGKPVLVNPFVMKWLAARGRWDESRLVRDLARHHFAAVQLNGPASVPRDRRLLGPERYLAALTRARFSPGVLRAVELWYEVLPALKDYPYRKLYVPK